MDKRPLILITNDDGITAPGIRHLIEAMNELGDVVVVAPSSPQSGMGHAITVNNTLFVEPVNIDNGLKSSILVVELLQIVSNWRSMNCSIKNLICVFPASIMDPIRL